MDIKKLLDFYSFKIRQKAPLLIKDLINQLSENYIQNVSQLETILSDFVLSGKLIRGSLYLLISKIYGCKDIDDLVDIAFAIELNHSGLLIHDDIMDNDRLRRGKASVHIRYSLLSDSLGIDKKEEFGRNMAICLGDICFYASNFLIENSKKPLEVKQRIKKYYSLQIIKTGFGQMLDVEFGLSKKEPTLSDILKIYQYKTANYTFSSTFVAGYYSSGKKDNQEVARLEKIGYSMGIIFQIIDDLIGFSSDSKIIGEKTGADVMENKKTIIRHFMFKKMKDSERDFALRCYGNKQLSLADLKKLREIFYKREVDREINKYILNESNKAKANISKLNLSSNNKKILFDFLDYLVLRQR